MATQGSILRILKDSSGNGLNALQKTTTFESEALLLGEFDEFGIIIKWVEDSGTGNYTVKPQYSPDSGSTWWDMPEGLNTETAAGMAAVSATGWSAEHWRNLLPNHKNVRTRFVFTAASSPTFSITAYVTAQKVKRATDI